MGSTKIYVCNKVNPNNIGRCELSTDNMVKIIEKEFEHLQEDLDNGIDADDQVAEEKEDLMKEFKEDKIDLDKGGNWAYYEYILYLLHLHIYTFIYILL